MQPAIRCHNASKILAAAGADILLVKTRNTSLPPGSLDWAMVSSAAARSFVNVSSNSLIFASACRRWRNAPNWAMKRRVSGCAASAPASALPDVAVSDVTVSDVAVSGVTVSGAALLTSADGCTAD